MVSRWSKWRILAYILCNIVVCTAGCLLGRWLGLLLVKATIA